MLILLNNWTLKASQKTENWRGRNEVTKTSGRLHPLWPQNKWPLTPWTTNYRHTRQDRWTQTELASALAKNATKPNPFEIILLQTTRKENNWKTEETLARAVVTLEPERIKGPNPWCLWWWWYFIAHREDFDQINKLSVSRSNRKLLIRKWQSTVPATCSKKQRGWKCWTVFPHSALRASVTATGIQKIPAVSRIKSNPHFSLLRSSAKSLSTAAGRPTLLLWWPRKYSRGADKSLDRPGRKQARKHVRDARDINNIETQAVIKAFFFFQGKDPKEIHAILIETLACFLPCRAKDLSAPL